MKSYELKETKHKDLFRVVDREGNWSLYFHKPTSSYLRGVTSILDEGYAKGYGFQEYLLNTTPEKARQILQAAGERGDMVHRFIDQALNSEIGSIWHRTVEVHNRETGGERELSNSEWDAVLSFGRFWEAHAPHLIVSEAPVFNKKQGYAGTADAFLVLTKACGVRTCKCEGLVGKIGLWDWKTSGKLYPSYEAQGGAYANSENLRDYLPAKAKIEYIGLLRLGTSHKTTGGYELKAINDVGEAFERFLSSKQISDREYVPFDPTKDIEDIPDVVEIVVTKYALKASAKKHGARKGSRKVLEVVSEAAVG